MERFLKHWKEKAEVMEEGEEATLAVVQVASILRASNPVAMPVQAWNRLDEVLFQPFLGPDSPNFGHSWKFSPND